MQTDSYGNIKKRLLDISREIGLILQAAASTDGLSVEALKSWGLTTAQIERQLTEETIRVAVVGSIKSGKSTLLNALFGGDYVKRGAGVVTSIITKVRPGNALKAKLDFKTWDEVNAEMNEAMVLFSAIEPDAPQRRFDINRADDRQDLHQRLSRLNAEHLIAEDARDPNSVLLTECLKGYDRIKEFVSFEPESFVLEAEDFYRQKEFVGDQSLAVFLKDVHLCLQAPEGFGENVEIADCQGSDSPNPFHLAMIQDYLIQTHLIIYALSSRTGVRRADIRFLNLIKTMGLAGSIFFVVNCDFSEHDNLQDLKGVVDRVKEEVGMVVPSPRLFAVSALYNLFKSLEAQGDHQQALSRKDRLRLEQWREEKEMVAYSDYETERLLKAVVQKVSSERLSLLVDSNLERVAGMATGIGDWIQINQDFLTKDSSKVREAFVEMDKRRQACDQVTMVIKDTLDGTTRKLKNDLGAEVDRFFDPRFGDIVREIMGFVDGYPLPVKECEQELESSSFLAILYRLFQAIQQAGNRFLAEAIHPKLVDFARRQEERIKDIFEQVSSPYNLMIQDAVDRYQETGRRLGINIPLRPFKPIRPPEIAVTKSEAQLRIPHLISTMQYSNRLKTEAIVRLGLYNTMNSLKRLFKRPVRKGSQAAIRSLEDSVQRIKEQMKSAIAEHLLDYKENLKFQYLFRLVDAMSGRLYDGLLDRVRAFTGTLLDMENLIENQRLAKDELMDRFSPMHESISRVLTEIRAVESLVAERH